MTAVNSINPAQLQGKSSYLVDKQAWLKALPYDPHRVTVECGHSPLYTLSNYAEQPLFCGLCLLKQGFEAEVPGRIHEFKTLAENGNPETSPRFMLHMTVSMGLMPPSAREALKGYRLARGQFSRPSWGQFPVTSALWKLMGDQPPLAVPLIFAVQGHAEALIAKRLDDSVRSITIRTAKGIRTTMRYLPRGRSSEEAQEHGSDNPSGEAVESGS